MIKSFTIKGFKQFTNLSPVIKHEKCFKDSCFSCVVPAAYQGYRFQTVQGKDKFESFIQKDSSFLEINNRPIGWQF